ncbi:MAG: hypothetical protein HC831_07555, partial [Chloroflexia bacterium]|nr:hypothetical protein [Chloroflexia bacterium]
MKSLSDLNGIDDIMAPSTMGINDVSLNKLVGDLLDLNTQRLTLLGNSSEKSAP